MTHTFESILRVVQGLPWAIGDNTRQVHWLVRNRQLGVSKGSDGRLELFVGSTAIVPSIRRVQDSLEVRSWIDADSTDFDASRLLLPGGDPFEGFGALVCMTLLSEGVETDPVRAFSRTEPIIAMALDNVGPSETSVIGLTGELILLTSLLRGAANADVLKYIDSWKGSARSSRDFQIVGTGIEVKTTVGTTSIHYLHGLAQCEVGHSVDGEIESHYFIVSIGLSSSDDGDFVSVPLLVESVLDKLDVALGADSTPKRALFLDRLGAYGNGVSSGYNHSSMKTSPRWGQRWKIRFIRIYDMLSPQISIFRADAYAAHASVISSDTTVAVQFPALGSHAVGAPDIASLGAVLKMLLS